MYNFEKLSSLWDAISRSAFLSGNEMFGIDFYAGTVKIPLIFHILHRLVFRSNHEMRSKPQIKPLFFNILSRPK